MRITTLIGLAGAGVATAAAVVLGSAALAAEPVPGTVARIVVVDTTPTDCPAESSRAAL
ncbi:MULTISPECIES: hypothetical protein [Catenuloplanes]|uniref:Uncharacterized protein n=1 Tax=Catenuloplanes niger TaxID=587534 RepID=A0AAE4CZS2_9ACTN|nr:hypothetical protein [Catenuloplanes niger]MDR7327194.1 hypothetical protein [Catenuloplanes niger]